MSAASPSSRFQSILKSIKISDSDSDSDSEDCDAFRFDGGNANAQSPPSESATSATPPPSTDGKEKRWDAAAPERPPGPAPTSTSQTEPMIGERHASPGPTQTLSNNTPDARSLPSPSPSPSLPPPQHDRAAVKGGGASFALPNAVRPLPPSADGDDPVPSAVSSLTPSPTGGPARNSSSSSSGTSGAKPAAAQSQPAPPPLRSRPSPRASSCGSVSSGSGDECGSRVLPTNAIERSSRDDDNAEYDSLEGEQQGRSSPVALLHPDYFEDGATAGEGAANASDDAGSPQLHIRVVSRSQPRRDDEGDRAAVGTDGASSAFGSAGPSDCDNGGRGSTTRAMLLAMDDASTAALGAGLTPRSLIANPAAPPSHRGSETPAVPMPPLSLPRSAGPLGPLNESAASVGSATFGLLHPAPPASSVASSRRSRMEDRRGMWAPPKHERGWQKLVHADPTKLSRELNDACDGDHPLFRPVINEAPGLSLVRHGAPHERLHAANVGRLRFPKHVRRDADRELTFRPQLISRSVELAEQARQRTRAETQTHAKEEEKGGQAAAQDAAAAQKRFVQERRQQRNGLSIFERLYPKPKKAAAASSPSVTRRPLRVEDLGPIQGARAT